MKVEGGEGTSDNVAQYRTAGLMLVRRGWETSTCKGSREDIRNGDEGVQGEGDGRGARWFSGLRARWCRGAPGLQSAQHAAKKKKKEKDHANVIQS